MRKTTSILPDAISIGSLFMGFCAVLLVARGRPLNASWCIMVAAILDGLDGTAARLLHREGRLGREIDSLVDVVSFGVAPAALVYYASFRELGVMGMALAFLPLVCGMIRLARFNVQAGEGGKTRGFKGIPITGSGMILASFFVFVHATHESTVDVSIWISLVAAVSALMLSPIPYGKFPVIKVARGHHPLLSLALMVAAAAAIILDPARALFPLSLLYLFSGPLLALEGLVTGRMPGRRDTDEPEEGASPARLRRRLGRRRKGE